MNKVFSLLFCILLLSHVALGDFDFNSVVSISKDDDVVRAYASVQLPGGFIATGVSVDGSLVEGDGVNVDTSFFKFSTLGSFPILQWFYYHGSVSAGAGGSIDISTSALSSAYIPTYVIEYVEKNGQEGLQIGEDDIVGHINLAKYTYDVDIETNKQATGFNVYHITATSSNGLFQMNFTLADQPVEVDGNRISAEQTKIDIGIYNYYDDKVNKASSTILCKDLACGSTGPSSNQSSLALLSFYAAGKFDLDLSGNAGITVQNDNGIYAGFNWVSNAKVTKEDGTVSVSANVVTSVNGTDNQVYGSAQISGIFTADASHKFLVQSFEGIRPSAVEWDPTMGGASEKFQNENSGFRIASSFVLVLVGLVAALLL
ncbi:hypothetical protein DICPUDRAFT_99303 [Dictyostelium purpureum]|uniref:Uncharacterized protein n=1 Tax=Dictyostelium purpureum TaxID=5786 RepID=F0ZY29_DICPU|nr:uncharacterized protein DICPUDRAFT_99303 [Dictyostelium purpureum]EGC31150.1 hypothetical protein DICPUDRAFT_99303 [Dictyostelium purpureum]|eukprot:XP_003292316.1 hypothetical protein DICPUDRAFT_99303 [Dictyostelium purpureum]